MTTNPAPKHYEIVPRYSYVPHIRDVFATFEEARDMLISDPLLSHNENHPYFWGNFFFIVPCSEEECVV